MDSQEGVSGGGGPEPLGPVGEERRRPKTWSSPWVQDCGRKNWPINSGCLKVTWVEGCQKNYSHQNWTRLRPWWISVVRQGIRSGMHDHQCRLLNVN